MNRLAQNIFTQLFSRILYKNPELGIIIPIKKQACGFVCCPPS